MRDTLDKMKLSWVGIVVGLCLGEMVSGNELVGFNATELSHFEAHGASLANANEPLMVGLTLIQSAAAKGAGNTSLLQRSCDARVPLLAFFVIPCEFVQDCYFFWGSCLL